MNFMHNRKWQNYKNKYKQKHKTLFCQLCNGVQHTGYTYAQIDGVKLLPSYFTKKINY